MNHQITLQPEQYEHTDGLLLVKHDPLYATNDTLVITLQGQREQKVRYIKQIVTDKVNMHFCYLLLSETLGINDIPESVGGDTKITLHDIIR